MGACLYCGKPAGWFREKHKDCDAKYRTACEEVVALAREAVVSSGDLPAMEAKAREIASGSFVQEDTIPGLLLNAWERAVQGVLEDSVLSVEEEAALERAASHFGWKQDDLDKNGAYTNLVKGGIIRDVLEGKVPTRCRVEGPLPFNFQKDEQLIWPFPEVKYYEVRSRRSFVGGYQGVSLRIARGVYYRVGGFRGSPVETAEAVHADTGLLGVTQKHLYFAGPTKSFRIRYDKIVSFTPYSDGIGLQRDAASAKPQSFVTGDGWFIYNLVTNLANLQAGRTVASTSNESKGTDERGVDDEAFGLPVVGESNYQAALESICGERNDYGEDKVVEATLVLEDTNPYDPQAVRVDIQGKAVGYLSRPNARTFREGLARKPKDDTALRCRARIRGGWDRGDGDLGLYGVSLDVAI
jgi:hypothetical protein